MCRRMQLVLGALLVCFNATAVLGQVTFVPNDLNPGDTYHVAFVTDGRRDALSSVIGDYNAFVQTEAERQGAETANWGVDWFAIGSTETVHARNNIPVDTSPIYLLNNTRIADNSGDLWDGDIQNPFFIDQFGDPDFSSLVWTGTSSSGRSPAFTALGDDRGLARGNSEAGEPHAFGDGNVQWIRTGQQNQGQSWGMYAVSEVLTVVPEPTTLGTCMLLSGLGALGGFGRRKRERRSVPSRA